MSAADVGAHGGEAVGKALGHETLRRQVIALIELMPADDVEDAGIALQAGRVQDQPVEQMGDAAESTLRILQRYAPDDSMHFISAIQQILGEIAAILPGDPGNQRPFGHAVSLPTANRRSARLSGPPRIPLPRAASAERTFGERTHYSVSCPGCPRPRQTGRSLRPFDPVNGGVSGMI